MNLHIRLLFWNWYKVVSYCPSRVFLLGDITSEESRSPADEGNGTGGKRLEMKEARMGWTQPGGKSALRLEGAARQESETDRRERWVCAERRRSPTGQPGCGQESRLMRGRWNFLSWM